MNQKLIYILQCDAFIAATLIEAYDADFLNPSAVAGLNVETTVFKPRTNFLAKSTLPTMELSFFPFGLRFPMQALTLKKAVFQSQLKPS